MRKLIISIILLLFAFFPLAGVLAQTTNYRYTGQELDPSSGLYYYGQRYYQPEVSRFTSPDLVLKNLNDPWALKQQTGQELEQLLSNPQVLNEYSYVQNNPVLYVDPEGEFNFETNQVEGGDTLYGVFGNNWQEVANYNNLQNPNLIFPGQHIDIPEFTQKTIWQNIADIATAFIPGVSDVRDAIETYTKEDFITGRALTPGEQSLTFSGFATPLVLSAKQLRSLNRAGKAFDNLADLGFRTHGLDQLITRGVKPNDIKDALIKPVSIVKKIDNLGRASFRYFGQQAMITINKAKEVITAWRF